MFRVKQHMIDDGWTPEYTDLVEEEFNKFMDFESYR